MSTPSCRLAIKAIPNAGRDEIVGWLGDALKVKVRAPALDGRANDALCAFLAEALGLPRRAVTVASGEKSRQKCIEIAGLSLEQARARLPGA
ncbi:MAG: DUF167 domain-containing protein [Opitutaceae bacterium]|nr:DUF167 domain-containing protein [Opitutaceae bacterium]